MPLYLKSHSYGEYVFDWAWADAYQRHGLRYYPKLLNAVPFTPVTGPRLLATSGADRGALLEAALEFARDTGVSSLHCLFPAAPEVAAFESAGLMLRASVQFHWSNEGFSDFEDFLARMSHDKRKKIRQERRKVREAGIEFRWLRPAEATEADWRFFVECYNRTYRAHHSSPYLNLDFFLRLAQAMPERLLLILGYREGLPVASAFNIIGDETLYGRYWGTKEFHSGLHFETCYYQAIEFCIAEKLGYFEGGAQGEHKLARGYVPTTTFSAHYIVDPGLRRAIADYLVRERAYVEAAGRELSDMTPFRKDLEVDA